MPFKFTLRLGSSSKQKEIYENGPDLSGGGAYRNHREEFLGRSSWAEPPKKLTPSMVKLPPSSSKDAIKTSKSSNDLANSYKLSAQLAKSTPDISTDPKGGTSHNRDSSALHRNAKANKDDKRDSKKQEKEKKESEKKRIADQKKREKAAAQEQAKQDKLRIQRDRQIAQQQARDVKIRKEQEQNNKKKGPAPPVTTSQSSTHQVSNSQARIPQAPSPQGSNPRQQYSTNTLESSISRSSGPPPYAELPKRSEPNKNDATGNTSFAKPIEESSWDMISEHRHQISKTVASGASTKQMMLDLQFSFDKAQIDANNRNISDV